MTKLFIASLRGIDDLCDIYKQNPTGYTCIGVSKPDFVQKLLRVLNRTPGLEKRFHEEGAKFVETIVESFEEEMGVDLETNSTEPPPLSA